MISVDPKNVTLAQLIQGRLFRIPQYQRTYSWQRKQRQEMFGDIQRIHDKGDDRIHFMATVVGLRRETKTIMTEEHHVIEIVDGQQRLTTLILLLKAITKAIDSSDTKEQQIGKGISRSLVKDDKATLLLLQTNHDAATISQTICGRVYIHLLRPPQQLPIANFCPPWRTASSSSLNGRARVNL